MLMYILFGFLILVAAIVLLALFLPNKIEFRFTLDFWEYRFSNIFYKHHYSSKDVKEAKEIVEKLDEEEVKKVETKIPKSPQNEQKEKSLTPATSKTAEEILEQKTEEQIENEILGINEADDENESENSRTENNEIENNDTNWLERFQKLWEEEEKLVVSLLKFTVKAVKRSQKLLSPSKIELKLIGGFQSPAETGWLYSAFVMISSYFEENRGVDLEFYPDFSESAGKWKFDGMLRYKFSLAKLVFFVIYLLLSSPYLQIIKAILARKKSKKLANAVQKQNKKK